MRELKFRIWNNRYNEFVRPDYGLIGFCYPLDGSISALTTNGEPMEDCSIEQYTGLKDKNGKEIYEGDIVKINGWWDAAGPAGYDKNLCAIKWDEEITGFAPFNVYDCDCSVYHYAEDCEVIGNIHENPELLGKEKEC